MTTEQEHSNGWCCSDCLVYLANGEENLDWSRSETDAFKAKVAAAGDITLGRMIGEDGCGTVVR